MLHLKLILIKFLEQRFVKLLELRQGQQLELQLELVWSFQLKLWLEILP